MSYFAVAVGSIFLVQAMMCHRMYQSSQRRGLWKNPSLIVAEDFICSTSAFLRGALH
jgi:hypothetical protein